ncbi:hypothetical protein ATCC90586_009551 [Pythium insidiosum]|nr:hypothetical protein ATCC90586_009551 [Pythium insidiosum]
MPSTATAEAIFRGPEDADFLMANDISGVRAVENTGCEDTYQRVDECMKKHNGRVSACSEEWTAFRKCHEQFKAQQAKRKEDNQSKQAA